MITVSAWAAAFQPAPALQLASERKNATMSASLYTLSAQYYDIIYNLKDYAQETQTLLRLIETHKPDGASFKTLLDVACGTGGHLVFLARHFECAGLDLEPALLAIARAKLPSLPFHQGDMRDFDLGQQFDLVTCLFSAIGYVKTSAGLQQGISNMARHVAPGGMLIVEPWFTPETFIAGHLHLDTVEKPGYKLARMSVSKIIDGVSVIDLHHLVGTPQDGVTHFSELHELALFTHAQYTEAFVAAGLRVVYDERGLIGRGLYLGLK
jgi:SAM-dependent methyltransferase